MTSGEDLYVATFWLIRRVMLRILCKKWGMHGSKSQTTWILDDNRWQCFTDVNTAKELWFKCHNSFKPSSLICNFWINIILHMLTYFPVGHLWIAHITALGCSGMNRRSSLHLVILFWKKKMLLQHKKAQQWTKNAAKHTMQAHLLKKFTQDGVLILVYRAY